MNEIELDWIGLDLIGFDVNPIRWMLSYSGELDSKFF